jgi:hypothetical protein
VPRDPINLNRLAYFATVVDTGSFTRAAERLGISKAVVSQQVARLERELRVTLLLRTTRKVVPTDAGRTLHGRCSTILREAGSRWMPHRRRTPRCSPAQGYPCCPTTSSPPIYWQVDSFGSCPIGSSRAEESMPCSPPLASALRRWADSRADACRLAPDHRRGVRDGRVREALRLPSWLAARRGNAKLLCSFTCSGVTHNPSSASH